MDQRKCPFCKRIVPIYEGCNCIWNETEEDELNSELNNSNKLNQNCHQKDRPELQRSSLQLPEVELESAVINFLDYDTNERLFCGSQKESEDLVEISGSDIHYLNMDQSKCHFCKRILPTNAECNCIWNKNDDSELNSELNKSNKLNQNRQQNDRQGFQRSRLQLVQVEEELANINYLDYNTKESLFCGSQKECEHLIETGDKVIRCLSDNPNPRNDQTGVGDNVITVASSTTTTTTDAARFGDSFQNSRKQKYQCPSCPKTFPNNSKLQRHIRVHTGESPFECTLCRCRFKQKAHLNTHLGLYSDRKLFICDKCGIEFPFKCGLAAHRCSKKEKKYFACDFCEKNTDYNTNEGLLSGSQKECEHLIETGDEDIHCLSDSPNPRNDQIFIGKYKITFASSTTDATRFGDSFQNSRKQKYQCSSCPKTFPNNSKYQRHIRVHTGELPFECTFCGCRFKEKTHLNRHRGLYLGRKLFMCVKCGIEFPLKCALVAHHCLKKEKKYFACDFCEKKFASKRYLVEHRRSHIGERTYKCRICGVDYLYRQGLQRHNKKQHQ